MEDENNPCQRKQQEKYNTLEGNKADLKSLRACLYMSYPQYQYLRTQKNILKNEKMLLFQSTYQSWLEAVNRYVEQATLKKSADSDIIKQL